MIKYRVNMAPNGVKIKKVKRRFFSGWQNELVANENS